MQRDGSKYAGETNEQAALSNLIRYCQENDWAGHDPYDALNSKLFETLPQANNRLVRIAFTQLLKRSPFDLRGLLRIPKTQNPKALGLFLSAFVKLSRSGFDGFEPQIDYMIDRIAALRTPNCSYSSWGYSFPWQGRMELVPAGAPNLVCTVFVADSLLDAYEQRGDQRCLAMAVGAAEYILNELYWVTNSSAGFSYPRASLHSETHNANLLASAMLCRIFSATRMSQFVEPALRVARNAASKQRADGSWFYGELPTQHWIDNFHTGYNLLALRTIGKSLDTYEFAAATRNGFKFYRDNFFCKDGSVKYFHDRQYPIDIHCVAQSIITLSYFADDNPESLQTAHSVLEWAMRRMSDPRGFFYYRVLRLGTIKTSYMRWSQAWMVLAMSTLLHESRAAGREVLNRPTSVSAQPC